MIIIKNKEEVERFFKVKRFGFHSALKSVLFLVHRNEKFASIYRRIQIYLCNALAKVLANFLGREFCDSGAQDGIYRSS